MNFKVGDYITNPEIKHAGCNKRGAIFKIVDAHPSTQGFVFEIQCQKCLDQPCAIADGMLYSMGFLKAKSQAKTTFRGFKPKCTQS